MINILSVQSSARYEGSYSRTLSAELVAKLNADGNATIVERDLAKAAPHISANWIGANYTPKDDRSADQSAILGDSDTFVNELKAADVIVIGVPVYNFSAPALLKSWIDQICRVGETFQYSAEGPKGLLEGKKAYIVLASGGVPVGSPVDFATPYLKHILGFIGISDVEIIAAEGVLGDVDVALEKARTTIQAIAA